MNQKANSGSHESYNELDYWRRYQKLYPERYRLDPGNEPIEFWWEWRGAKIHLDSYDPGDAALTVIALHGGGGYGRMLSPIGVMPRQAGVRVLVPDLPGYGLAKRPGF